MTLYPDLDRRRCLQATGAAGLLGVWPALGRHARAATPQPQVALAVVMLRGALDGLAAVPAVGDPHWRALRPTDENQPLPLGGDFALHPALANLARWHQQGELLTLHAVASPYRERSHFDAQQQLESGGTRPFELSTGWLGRALQSSGRAGLALGAAMPLGLRGADRAGTWTPPRGPATPSDWLDRVAALYQRDALLASRLRQGLEQRAMAESMAPAQPGMSAPAANAAPFVALAAQAGRFLADPQGPSAVWLDLDGWDTHSAQGNRLQRQLATLDAGLQALREGVGPHWARTTLLVITEFGRTAAYNGSGGTDHGTGGVAFLAGGAVAGGRVLADWPGLSPTNLLDGRDLRPTLDLRAVLGAVAQRHFGLSTAAVRADLLPGAPAPLQGLWKT